MGQAPGLKGDFQQDTGPPPPLAVAPSTQRLHEGCLGGEHIVNQQDFSLGERIGRGLTGLPVLEGVRDLADRGNLPGFGAREPTSKGQVGFAVPKIACRDPPATTSMGVSAPLPPWPQPPPSKLLSEVVRCLESLHCAWANRGWAVGDCRVLRESLGGVQHRWLRLGKRRACRECHGVLEDHMVDGIGWCPGSKLQSSGGYGKGRGPSRRPSSSRAVGTTRSPGCRPPAWRCTCAQ